MNQLIESAVRARSGEPSSGEPSWEALLPEFPRRLRDDEDLVVALDEFVRVMCSERQLYFQIFLPFEEERHARWLGYSHLEELEKWEVHPVDEGFFQVSALEIRRRGEWSELEGTIPLEGYLTDSQLHSAIYLSGLKSGLYERVLRFQKSSELEDMTSLLPGLMSELFCVIGRRIREILQCGGLCELRALYHFVRHECSLLKNMRSASGFLELMLLDDEVPCALAEAEELLLLEELDAAHDILIELLPRFSSHGRLLECMGRLSLLMEEPCRATLFFQKALEDRYFLRPEMAQLGLARAEAAMSRYPKAMEHLKKGIEHNPCCLDLFLWKSHLLREMGAVDEALEVLDDVEQRDCACRNLHLERGYAYLCGEREREALEQFCVEIERHPDHLEAIEKVIELAEKLGDVQCLEHYSEKKQEIESSCHAFSDWLQTLEELCPHIECVDMDSDELMFWLRETDEKEESQFGFEEPGRLGGKVGFPAICEEVEDVDEVDSFEARGQLEVDDASFFRAGIMKHEGCHIVYEGGSYRCFFSLPYSSELWERVSPLACQREVARLMIAREGEEIQFMFRLFPRPLLDMEEWQKRWKADELPLVGDLFHPHRHEESPSRRWDRLYRHILALMSSHLRLRLEAGDISSLVALSRWLGKEGDALPCPAPAPEEVATGAATKAETGCPIARWFGEWLGALFSIMPGAGELCLRLPPGWAPKSETLPD